MESPMFNMIGNPKSTANLVLFLLFLASCLMNPQAAPAGGVWANQNMNRPSIVDYAGKNIRNTNGGYSLMVGNNNGGGDVSDNSDSSGAISTPVDNGSSDGGANDETMFYVRPGSFGSYNSGGIRRLMGGPDSVRNFRSSFENLRFMSPYALRHYLASKLQNSDFLGKRMGSEFLGKKRSTIPANAAAAATSADAAIDQQQQRLYPDLGSQPSKRLNKINPEEDQMMLKALNGDFYKQIKDKKINDHRPLMMKNRGWIKPPQMFQYYTKGSEFLGGPGR